MNPATILRASGTGLAWTLLVAVAIGAPAAASSTPSGQGPGPDRAAHGWGDFPVFVWRQDRRAEAPGMEFARAFGGANLGRGEDGLDLAREGLAFYVDNAAGRDELHLDRDRAYTERLERWYAERDDRLLVREPCLNDPAVIERLDQTLSKTLARPSARFSLGFSLGDEVSFTPYGGPEDSCLCEHCAVAWRAFLEQARRSGRTALSAEMPLAQASTDRARQALETGEAEAVEAWLLRRAFTQEVMQRRLAELAEAARARLPAAPLGLMGMIGRTAFGGVAVERVLPRLDFAECYRVGDARELLFTLRSGQQRVLQTIFFDERSGAAPVWFAWESWLRGADGLVLWSDRELAARPGYAESLLGAVASIRAVEANAPGFSPRPAGVALVNDGDSIAYGWLFDARLDGPTWPRRLQGFQEERGSRERLLRASLRLLEDCGAMPGALPLEQVGKSTVERFPLLVLNHLRVLDGQGAARLFDYLEAGGRLLVGGDLGVTDARGRRPEKPWIDALRARAPERVALWGEDLETYLGDRLIGGDGLRRRTSLALARAGVPTAPWTVESEGPGFPWLCAWSTAAEESLLCAALPNLPEQADREPPGTGRAGPSTPRLSDLWVSVKPREGWGLSWIRPAPGTDGRVLLPAGEALVFRLESR